MAITQAPVTPPDQAAASTTTGQPTTSNIMNQLPRGPADLPLAGSKNAPKKFKGQSSDVEDFVRYYEKLCTKYAVTSDRDRIENIAQYCSRQVREFLEGLPTYQNGTWAQFKRDILEFFDADHDDRRFRIKDITKYIESTRQKSSIKDLAAWRKYTRGFIRIAGWLKKKSRIGDEEYNTYFWIGIPRRFRNRLEQRLMSQAPTHDIATPFQYNAIEKVAKSLLQRDRFDRERFSDDEDSETEIEDEDSSSNSSSDSEASSESDSEDIGKDYYARHKKKMLKRKKEKERTKDKKNKKKKKVRFDQDSDAEEDVKAKPKDKTKRTSSHDREVEDLIDQLNRMSINDPSYSTTYFRAVRLDPLVQQIVPSPLTRQKQATARPPSQAPLPPPGTGQRDAPPHFDRLPYIAPR